MEPFGLSVTLRSMEKRLAGEGELDARDATRRFYDLVWPQRAAVLRVARILSGNDAEADDLAQETLLKAFNGIGGFKPGTDVKAWLMTILRRTRIDRVRAAASSAGTLSLDAIEVEPPAAPGSEETDLYGASPEQVLAAFSDRQVIDALQRLPEDIRMTLLLVDVEQLKLEEAAEVLRVPVGTVKSRTHRGRAMLRQALLPVAREMRLVRE